MKSVEVTPVFFIFHGQEFGFMNESSTFQAELLSIGHRTQPIQNIQGPNKKSPKHSLGPSHESGCCLLEGVRCR